ncbi:MAG: acetyl-CoA hydrolase/transferase [Rhodocyclaceae bacterium]|nr:MAG: acetyl-CoA hydrolase/transferase [Rhodocyclaceae bacterium]TND04871.1 MAG: acetyl-CoA hydrolase/transferase [Rhodocyclaceae bacterium]
MGSAYDYKSKLISVEQALAKIKTDDCIVSALGAAEPNGLLDQLHTIADRVRNVSVSTCLPMRPFKWFMDPAMNGHFEHHAWFYSANIRKAAAEAHTSTYVPNHLHSAAMDRILYRKPTIFIGSCTPPDRFGYVSLAFSVVYERDLMEVADIVILEVNDQVPFTWGDTVIHLDQVDYLVEHSSTPFELPAPETGDRDRKIGGYIAEHIEDGSTMQLGIGGIPNAVAGELLQKRDLAIHTEMLTDGMVDLFEAGVIARAPRSLDKGIMRGKMVAAFALGTKKLYDFLDRNPGLALMRGSWVNNPYVIAHNRKQVSINTTLEVDLTGQVCSESIGHRQYSGTGGQSDTAIGAQMSEGGKSFIALYSTADVKQPDGTRKTISKIAPMLTPGAAVTLQRSNVDFVVTEYGAVRLRGAPVNERARRLISIAHPDFRAGLQEEAEKLGFI